MAKNAGLEKSLTATRESVANAGRLLQEFERNNYSLDDLVTKVEEI